MRVEIGFVQLTAINLHAAVAHLDRVAGQTDDSLDIALRRIFGKPEYDDVAAIDLWRPAIVVVIDQLVDKNPFAIVQVREHRGAFDLYRLDDEDHHQRQNHQRKDQIADQQARFMPQVFPRRFSGPLYLNVSIVVRMDGAEWRWLVKLLTKHAFRRTKKTTPDSPGKRSTTIRFVLHDSLCRGYPSIACIVKLERKPWSAGILACGSPASLPALYRS